MTLSLADSSRDEDCDGDVDVILVVVVVFVVMGVAAVAPRPATHPMSRRPPTLLVLLVRLGPLTWRKPKPFYSVASPKSPQYFCLFLVCFSG